MRTTLAAIENVSQAEPGTPEHSTSRFWRCWWTATRAGRWTIEPADPVEPIWHVMDQRGLTREDLETALGSHAHVSYPESPPSAHHEEGMAPAPSASRPTP